VGSARVIGYTVRMTCLDHPCLPGDPTTGSSSDLFTLPTVGVDYLKHRGGVPVTQTVPLPQVEVTSRLTPLEAARLNAPPHPPLRASTLPLPVHYAASPTLLEALFVGAAVALFALAAILFHRFGPSFRRTRPLPSPLERALMLVERSRTHGLVSEQRKALEFLARELGRTGQGDL